VAVCPGRPRARSRTPPNNAVREAGSPTRAGLRMSSQENIRIVRQAHKAFNRPALGVFEMDILYRHASPDFAVDWSRSHGPEAGIYRGEAATRRLWETFFEAFDRVVVEPLDFIDGGESVVVPHHLRAVGRSGIEVEAHSAVVYTVRNGRIVEMRLYRQTGEAMKAVGLE
jgi:ketosteroid isomerase-like protein